jgi:hypothetical protein
MNLKIFYLGLLSIFVIASTQTYGMQRMQNAPKMEQKIKEHEAVIHAALPNLNVAAHHNKPEEAVQDISDKLGVHPAAPTGATVNHKVVDLIGRIGETAAGHGAGHETANERITDVMALQGNVTKGGVNRGVAGPGAAFGAGGANALMETVADRERAILARLKAAIAANAGAGVAVEGQFSTKTTNTAAGALAAGDFAAAALATNIEDFLAELGW